MKILMLSTYDKYGGAAIAATRLMHALSDAGTDVSMIVMDKQSEDTRIMQASTFFPKRHFYRERLSIFLANRLHRKNLFAVSIANCGADVTGTKAFAEADVIHLHWVNQGPIRHNATTALCYTAGTNTTWHTRPPQGNEKYMKTPT